MYNVSPEEIVCLITVVVRTLPYCRCCQFFIEWICGSSCCTCSKRVLRHLESILWQCRSHVRLRSHSICTYCTRIRIANSNKTTAKRIKQSMCPFNQCHINLVSMRNNNPSVCFQLKYDNNERWQYWVRQAISQHGWTLKSKCNPELRSVHWFLQPLQIFGRCEARRTPHGSR